MKLKLNTYFKNIKQQNVLLHKGLAVQLSYTFLYTVLQIQVRPIMNLNTGGRSAVFQTQI